MTKTEIKAEAAWRVDRAFAVTEKLTGDTRLWRKVAKLLLVLSTRELKRLKNNRRTQ